MLCRAFKLLWDERPLHEVIFGREDDSLSSTSMSFIEATTAFELGIPYDETWFSIPIKSRSYMVAARLGKEWLANLHEETAMKSTR